MKKLRLYLDTSVVSYLKQDDAPEKMQDTLKLWNRFKAGQYQAVLSDITLREINRCPDPKLSILLDHLNQIDFEMVTSDQESFAFAEKILDFGVLKQKSFDDCTHIAAAVVSNCDMIVSWNFKHIVNYKTIKGIKMITTAQGYKDILIYSPTMIVEGDAADD